jgi:alkylation response protein AidB-like acyl-CoA dehydrogenase
MFPEDLEAFRTAVRDWLRANTPPDIGSPDHPDRGILVWGGRNARFRDRDAEAWFRGVTERGWATPTWAVEYGGAGLDPARARALRQELAEVGGARLLRNFGTLMIGPLILANGTEEQKRRHLQAISRGQARWCLGFSEPNAGSDLASLQCRAEHDGGHYVVTGEKVWNSYAHQSDFMELLVRTDRSAAKHGGISVLLVDLASPGVRVSPIELISGKSQFCSTAFESVRVPDSERLGAENDGWRIVQEGLRYEREAVVAMTVSDGGFTGKRRASLVEIARLAHEIPEGPLPDDVAAAIAAVEIEQLAFRASERRAKDAAKLKQPVPHPSVFKFMGARVTQRRREIEMGLRGSPGTVWESANEQPGEDERAAREWLRTYGLSIEGGTSEIQLNVIAKRVLGMAGS